MSHSGEDYKFRQKVVAHHQVAAQSRNAIAGLARMQLLLGLFTLALAAFLAFQTDDLPSLLGARPLLSVGFVVALCVVSVVGVAGVFFRSVGVLLVHLTAVFSVASAFVLRAFAAWAGEHPLTGVSSVWLLAVALTCGATVATALPSFRMLSVLFQQARMIKKRIEKGQSPVPKTSNKDKKLRRRRK
ncbi:MAG: hypothetical protein MHM6MM_000653 [Cercozoa sp. M6MM]